MKKKLLTFTLILSFLTLLSVQADAKKSMDLDFTQSSTGELINKLNKKESLAIPVISQYGRLKSDNAVKESNIIYAKVALDRKGAEGAIRTGNNKFLAKIPYKFENNKPFSIVLWFFMYPKETFFTESLMKVAPVYKSGFHITYSYQKWAKDGLINFSFGTESNVDKIIKSPCPANTWHQVVISSSGKSVSMYLDGELIETKNSALIFSKNNSGIIGDADYKFDEFSIYSSELNAKEVKDLYEAGVASEDLANQELAYDSAAIELMPKKYGYYKVDAPIEVDVKLGDLQADKVEVNGKSYILPLEEKVIVSFDNTGLESINVVIKSNDRVVKTTKFPVAIYPFDIISSKLGVNEFASRQEEVAAIGINWNRVVVDWAQIEPKKQEYNWGNLDAIMDVVNKAKVNTIICFTGIPKWVKKATGSNVIPEDLELYKKIWTLIVARYDNVEYFEVWNTTNSGNDIVASSNEKKFKDYSILIKNAREAVLEENPNAKIIAGRVGFNMNVHIVVNSIVQSDANKDFEIFSAQGDSSTPFVNNIYQRVALKGAQREIWNTFAGVNQMNKKAEKEIPSWPIKNKLERDGAILQIKDIAIKLANGYTKIFLERGPSEYFPVSCVDHGTPGLKGLALAVFNGLINEDTRLVRLGGFDADTYVIKFINRSDKNGFLLFTSKGKKSVTVQEGELTVVDLFGNSKKIQGPILEIGEEPIYILDIEKVTK